jgi:hypothetical protein
MSEAFVYRWTNLSSGKYYIGYHKGSEDDGYICSSKSDVFWEDWNNKDNVWVRDIIYKGTVSECVELETWILRGVDLKAGYHYNMNVAGGIVMTQEVRDKLSKAHTGKVIPESVRAKMSAATSGSLNPMYNKFGLEHPSAKNASVYSYKTNRVIAKDICLHRWAIDNGYTSSCLQATAVGKRRQHKGVYAVYE